MKLELVSLTGVKFSDDVYEVIIPTADGEISVFPTHMPLVSLAVPGVLKVRKNQSDADDTMATYASLGGVVEITPDHVRILVDEVERDEEILEEEAKAALETAHKLKAQAKNAVELEKAQGMIDRQSVRLHVAGLKRRGRR